MKKRLLIGIITARVAESEQKQLLHGILHKAQFLDIDTVIFSNIYNFDAYFAHTEIENRIYDLIPSPRIDGLILTAESILNPEIQQYIYERIQRRNVPVVVTGAELPEMCCLNNDVLSDFEELTRHLLEIHHFTDIDILTGNQKMKTSRQRVEGCRNAMEQYGIPLPEENIIYGDFWMTSGEALAGEYVQKKRRLPQAVICANDYMAYGLCDTLMKYHIRVPEDVTIIGYEYVGDRFFHAPLLTTYLRNREAVGINAVEMLYSMLTGQKPECISLSGRLIIGDTCLCGANCMHTYNELARVRQVQHYLNMNIESNFEQQMTVCRNIRDYIQVLQEFVYLIPNVSGVYLCLYEDWCSTVPHMPTDDALMFCYRITSAENDSEKPQLFKHSQLYPEMLSGSKKPGIDYFAPIFFSGREFGYFILQYDKPDSYDAAFKVWLKVASHGLESLRVKNDIHTLLEFQNLSEFYDTTTGLLNYTGFSNEIDHALHKAAPEENLILLFIRTALFSDNTSIDSKGIFVQMEKQIAECLKNFTSGVQEFCAKIGDNLFTIGCIGQHEEGEEYLLSDKLNALILHLPLYSEHQGIDTLLCTTVQSNRAQAEKQAKRLYTQMQSQIEALSVIRNHLSFPKYHALRQALYRQPQKEWDAQEACRKFHLSYGYFRTMYKKMFGISFHQDVIQSRISLAKYLLLTTDQSIHTIAAQCGYEDDKYFLRQFRQITGCTPSVYKNT